MKQSDSGWSWIVTCACFIEHFLFIGMINTVGIYGVYIMDKFNVGLTRMTIIGSVFTSLGYAGAIMVIPIKARLGYRPIIMVGGVLTFIGYISSSFVSSFLILYLTMAIIPGIGHSMAYAVLLMSVDKYFDKKKFIGMAIGTIGGAVGIVVVPILSEYMLSEFGFEGAILIHSSLALHMVLCGAVVFPMQTTNNKDKDRKAKIVNENNTEAKRNHHEAQCMLFCRTPRFIAYLLTNFLFTAAIYIPSSQLPETAVSVGVTIADISFALSMGGISSAFGRASFGVLCHFFSYHIIKIWIFFLIAIAAVMLIVPFSKTMDHFMTFTILYGFFEGGINIGYNLSLKNLVKPTEYDSALSIGLLPIGVGALVGSPLTAFIKESTGSQGTPFYIGASILVLGALLICPFSKPKITDITDVEINNLPGTTDIDIKVLSQERTPSDVSDLRKREIDLNKQKYMTTSL